MTRTVYDLLFFPFYIQIVIVPLTRTALVTMAVKQRSVNLTTVTDILADIVIVLSNIVTVNFQYLENRYLSLLPCIKEYNLDTFPIPLCISTPVVSNY